MDKMVTRIKDIVKKIRDGHGNPFYRVALTLGVDATVLVKSLQISPTNNAIVGLASPHHFIKISELDTPELVQSQLKDCADGKFGELAAEIKCAVLSFQGTPPKMCPYIMLAGLPQKVNENNDFGQLVVDACLIVEKDDGNVVLLNQTTDGVSCEVQWNLKVARRYLLGEINYMSFPDTNHNVKNLRYQLVGGASVAAIGRFVLDPWLVVKGGVTKELFRVSDYASDALPLRLASYDTILKIMNCSCADTGNISVTVVSLAFMRLRSYAVNCRKLDWKQRAVFAWATFLWFSSFHTPGSTMITNKQNMLLESIAIMFLVSRSDVSQSRRLTSECNEHMFGMYRMILREFNTEQVIRIVQKSIIKLDAVFESNLATSRSNTSFKGYQHTMYDYLNSLKAGSGPDMSVGPVHVDTNKSAVSQLWEEVKGVLHYTTAIMTGSLHLFGVVPGNGLSPFAVDIDTATDLQRLVELFFSPHKKGARGNIIPSVTSIDTNDDIVVNDEDGLIDNIGEALSADVIANYVTEIQQVGDNDDELPIVVEELVTSNLSMDGDDILPLFDNGNSVMAKEAFKALIDCVDLDDVCDKALSLVKVLQLGHIDKGAVTTASKFNSRNGRWFSQKKKKDSRDVSLDQVCEDKACDDVLYIQRNSLIRLNCKHENKTSTVE